MDTPYDAIVLAGGTGRRLGGADKAMLVVGGRPLLSRVLDSVAAARTVSVVGPRRVLPTRPVVWVREDPPGSGPLAALAAGLGYGSASVVVVAACDLPLFSEQAVDRLRQALDAAPDADGALLVDDGGRQQPLAAAYRRAGLRAALERVGDPRDRPVRWLLDELSVVRVSAALAALDADTWDDLARIETQLPPANHERGPCPD